MSSARLIFIVLVFIAAVSVVGIYFARSNPAVVTPVSSPSSREIENTKQDTSNKALPSPISVETLKGSVVSINGDNLVVKSTNGDKNLSLSETKDFQKIVSGNQVEQASKTDVKTGQQVTLAIDKNSDKVLTLVITK